MKKLLSLSLICMLLCLPALAEAPLAPSENLPLEAVLPLARQEFQHRLNFTPDQAAPFSLSAHQWEAAGDDFQPAQAAPFPVWSVSFRYAPEEQHAFLDEMSNDLQLSIHLNARDGSILSSPWDEEEAHTFLQRYAGYQALSENEDYIARRQEAYCLAWDYLLESCGMTQEEAAPLIPRMLLLSFDWDTPALPIDYENAWWRVSFSLPGLEEQPALILAVEAESRYTYLDAGNAQDFALSYLGWMDWQRRWSRAQEGALALSQQWGDPLFWTYEQKAGFYQEYGMAPDLTGEGAETSCDMPEKTDTPYEAALQAAKAALRLHLQAEEAELETLKISAHFTNQFWHPAGDRAWVFHFYAPHATSRQPDSRYAAFVVSPAGDAVTVMRTTPDAGDQDYWSILEE